MTVPATDDKNVANPSDGKPAEGSALPNQGGTKEQNVPLKALQEEREKRQGLQAEVEFLKTQMLNITQQPVQQQVQAQQHQANGQLDQLWQTDPRKAMQAELAMAINWYDRVNAEVDLQEADAESKFKDFGEYRKDIRNFIKTLPPEQRGTKGVVEMAYFMAKGRNADVITKSREEAILAKIRAGESVQGFTGSLSQNPTPEDNTLTPQEVNAARAMGIKPEDYIKNKKR